MCESHCQSVRVGNSDDFNTYLTASCFFVFCHMCVESCLSKNSDSLYGANAALQNETLTSFGLEPTRLVLKAVVSDIELSILLYAFSPRILILLFQPLNFKM